MNNEMLKVFVLARRRGAYTCERRGKNGKEFRSFGFPQLFGEQGHVRSRSSTGSQSSAAPHLKQETVTAALAWFKAPPATTCQRRLYRRAGDEDFSAVTSRDEYSTSAPVRAQGGASRRYLSSPRSLRKLRNPPSASRRSGRGRRRRRGERSAR